MNKAVEKWFIGAMAVVLFVVFVGMAKNFDTATGTTSGNNRTEQGTFSTESITSGGTANGASRSSTYEDEDDDDDDRKSTYSSSQTIQQTPSTSTTPSRQQRPLTRSRAS